MSARMRVVTGIRLPCPASFKNSSSDGENIRNTSYKRRTGSQMDLVNLKDTVGNLMNRPPITNAHPDVIHCVRRRSVSNNVEPIKSLTTPPGRMIPVNLVKCGIHPVPLMQFNVSRLQ